MEGGLQIRREVKDRRGLGGAIVDLCAVFNEVLLMDGGRKVVIRDFSDDREPRFVVEMIDGKAEILTGYTTTITLEESKALQGFALALMNSC